MKRVYLKMTSDTPKLVDVVKVLQDTFNLEKQHMSLQKAKELYIEMQYNFDMTPGDARYATLDVPDSVVDRDPDWKATANADLKQVGVVIAKIENVAEENVELKVLNDELQKLAEKALQLQQYDKVNKIIEAIRS